MGQAIDLLKHYPRTKRDINQRVQAKTSEDQAIARRFDKAFFDGDRSHGYGGFNYHPKFWGPVINDFKTHFGLNENSSLLDIGCAKGFMLYDLQRLIPGICVNGIDISRYAIDTSHPEVKANLQVGNAMELPYPDNSFDVVISITTLHNLEGEQLIQALKEIERVKKQNSFITVDAYRNDEEKSRMYAWNLTARTILHVNEWIELFKQAGYTGDYYWFMP